MLGPSRTAGGLTLPTDASSLGDLRQAYDRTNYLRLEAFVGPDRMRQVQGHIEREAFYRRHHAGIGSGLCLPGAGPTTLLMHTLLNDPELFRAVEDLTGCPQIGCLTGRVYRLCSDDDLRDDWHGDNVDTRMVGLTVNLSAAAFAGGVLQLRNEADGKVTGEVHNVGPGDAVLFRIAPGLRHRNTQVTGDAAKTAFAGWFRAQPHFSSLLRGWLDCSFPRPDRDSPRCDGSERSEPAGISTRDQ